MIKKLILDGGQYESMGIMKKMYAYVISKEFQKVINGKHIKSYIQKQMGYLKNNDIDVLQNLTCKNIKFNCLYKAALAAYSYDVVNRPEKLDMDVTIMYGENEIYAKRSVAIVNKKCLKPLNVFECKGMGHGEALSKKPIEICKLIEKL
ncbi:hypothetical protein [Clostridium niameyense]|uniref:hypothetical protein n=1 Tax=Clostridium niameyense TaxID=1622073 RepID=UPI000AF38655|nr:hypothetical protein [Clostridium niameyense]